MQLYGEMHGIFLSRKHRTGYASKEERRQHMEKKTEEKDVNAMIQKAVCLIQGKGVEQNIPLAIAYLKKAQQNGSSAAGKMLRSLINECSLEDDQIVFHGRRK